eukprot:TRINITY_DN2196_c0_g2_i6.p1 TRINITY_DN2196_c0_g2~~TRINITY_DN2196_c0_g2_i6.p1  ORF type:complete len:1800 (+),score=717.05 TRINITY_DN2196_c0_g2_i6:776-6175(+)
MSNGQNGTIDYQALLAEYEACKTLCNELREKLNSSVPAEDLEDAIDAKNQLESVNSVLEQKLAAASKKCDELDMLSGDCDDLRADLKAEMARSEHLSKEVAKLTALLGVDKKGQDDESVSEFEIQSAASSPQPATNKRPSICTSEFHIGDTDDEGDERHQLALKLRQCEEERSHAQAELASVKEQNVRMAKQIDELDMLKDHAAELQQSLDEAHAALEAARQQIAALEGEATPEDTRANGHGKHGAHDDYSTESDSSISELQDLNLETEVGLLKSAVADAKNITAEAEADFAEHLEEARSRVQALEEELTEVLSSSATPRKRNTEAWVQDSQPPECETETDISEVSSGAQHLELLDAEIAKMKDHIRITAENDKSMKVAADELLEQQAMLAHDDMPLFAPIQASKLSGEPHLLQREIEILRETNRQLTEELVAINRSKEEVSKWQDMYQQQTEQFTSLQEQLSSTDDVNAARIVELERDLTVAKMNIQTITKRADEEAATCEAVREQLQQAKDERLALLRTMEEECKRAEQLSDECLNHKSTADKYAILLQEAEAKESMLTAQCQELSDVVDSLKTKTDATDSHTVQEMNEDSKKDSEERCRHLSENLKKAHEQCAVQAAKYNDVQKSLNQTISKLQSKVSELKAALSDSTTAKIGLETDLDLTKEDLETATINLRMQTESNEALKARLMKSETNLQNLTSSYNEVNSKLQAAEKEVRSLSGSLADAKMQIKMKDTEVDRLNATIARQASHEEKVKEQLDNIKNTLSVKQSSLETEASEAHSLKIRTIELEGRIGILSAELENAKAAVQASNARVRELQEALAAANEEASQQREQSEIDKATLSREAAIEHETAQEKIEALEHSLKMTREELEDKEEVIAEDKKVKADQLVRISDLVHQNGVAAARIFELEGLLKIEETTNKSVEGSNAALIEAQDELKALKEEMSTLRAELQAAKETTDEMKQNWSTTEDLLTAEKRKVLTLEDSLSAAIARLENSSNSASSVKAELEAAKKDLSFSAFGHSEAATALGAVRKEYEVKLEKATNETVALRKKLATLEGEHHALEAECRRLKECMSNTDVDYSSAVKQRNEAIDELKVRQSKLQDAQIKDAHIIAKLRAELEISEQSRREAAETYKAKIQEADAKLKEAEELSKKAESYQRKIDSSCTEIEALNAKLKITAKELTEANNKVWEIEQQKSDAERQLRKMQTELIAAQRQAQESAGSHESLVLQNNKLKMELEAVDEQVKEAQRRNKRLTDEMHIRSRRESKGQTPTEVASLQSRIRYLESELESRTGKVTPQGDQGQQKAWSSEKLLMQADIDCLKRKCLMLEDKVQSLIEDLREADEAVGDAEDRCREMEEELALRNSTLDISRAVDKSDSTASLPDTAPTNPAWIDLLTVEEARMDDLTGAASRSSAHQLSLCTKLKGMLSNFESRIVQTLQSGSLADAVRTVLRSVQEECKTVAKLIRLAEDSAKKVQERLAADIDPYKAAFVYHLKALKTAPSPWVDPIAKNIIQQHRGRWCGAAELLSDMLVKDTQDLDKVHHNLKLWENLNLSDYNAIKTNTLSGSIELQVQRDDPWPLGEPDSDVHHVERDKENARLRDELRAMQTTVRTLEYQLESAKQPVQSAHKPSGLEDDPFFKTCVLHMYGVDARYRLLLDVRGYLMGALVPIKLPDVSGRAGMRFKKAVWCVMFARLLRGLRKARKEERARVENAPAVAARALMMKKEADVMQTIIVDNGNGIANRTLLEGLQRLRETVTTSKARMDVIEDSFGEDEDASESESNDLDKSNSWEMDD